MKLFRFACFWVAVSLCTSVAIAQPGATPAPGAPMPVAPPPPPDDSQPPPPPVEDPGAAPYREGYALLVAGDFAAARDRLGLAATTATDPELRGAARELARLADDYLAKQGRILFGAAAAVADGAEDPADGRTSFIVTTTLASIYGGVVLIDLADADVRGGAAILLGATGAGLAGSLFGSRGRHISGGMAEGYSTGMLIGTANGLLLASPLGADSTEAFQMSVFGGLVVGGVGGLVYGDAVQPTRGQMSFVGTMATLGFATAGLGMIIVSPDIDSDTVLYTMAAGIDAGAVAGLVLGKGLTWSSGRARLAWLGALVGGLGGFGTAVLIGGGDSDGRGGAALTLAGTWGGFALSTYLTRDMRPDRRYLTSRSSAMVTPIGVPHGAGIGVSGAF